MEEINENELMSKKYKKICMTLNYIKHLLILMGVFLNFFFCFFSSSLV